MLRRDGRFGKNVGGSASGAGGMVVSCWLMLGVPNGGAIRNGGEKKPRDC